MDRIYRLLKDKKGEELKRMVEEGDHFADFVRIFRLLEDQSLEELLEEQEKGADAAGADATDSKTAGAEANAAPSDAGITVNDLNYRLRKAIKEPKRIFEPHQPYKKPGKRK